MQYSTVRLPIRLNINPLGYTINIILTSNYVFGICSRPMNNTNCLALYKRLTIYQNQIELSFASEYPIYTVKMNLLF